MDHSKDLPDEYRILAVDDEPIVHGILAQIISESKLPLVLAGTATSGFDALAIAGKMRPDICLLDINMTGMNGLDIARKLSDVLDYKPIIIYLTAYDRFDYAQQAIRLGATDYILKPIIREDLLDTLRRVVNTLQAQRLAKLEHEKLKKRLESVVPGAVATSAGTEIWTSTISRLVRQYVDEHYAERISLVTVADHVRLSPGYLGPLFKSECGISFRAYLRSVRVAKAKELMKDHRLNLSEIAQAIGYDDQNYFSQVFLEETGVRPGEYRGGGRRWAK